MNDRNPVHNVLLGTVSVGGIPTSIVARLSDMMSNAGGVRREKADRRVRAYMCRGNMAYLINGGTHVRKAIERKQKPGRAFVLWRAFGKA
jgi:hypothetical protein